MPKGITCALLGLFLLFSIRTHAQSVSGVIRDGKTNEPVIGAVVQVKGAKGGSTTDLDGRFEISPAPALPFTLLITYVGYENLEAQVSSLDKPLTLKLRAKEIELKGVEVTGSRISEKQKQAPLTVESMDIIAIKDCPQPSFYQALGTLKGVDMTTASLGFTVINTRGFNSTSPVRSLQLIDGVDNQSPGLNFSLGNFLGAPELDVLKVDLIAGASTAFYGPNAFNGVISITSRSPFIKPGLEVSVKAGERNLLETSVRWAQAFKNKSGQDKFGYKLNFFALRANDWEADNLAATPQSPDNERNPGGYDAINVYGDEYYLTSDFSKQPATNPGLMTYYRTGYREKDLVDYDTRNIKANAAVHYKFTDKIEGILSSSFGNGTTVYQGDNRYSLKDILFFQHRLEVRQPDKFFVRAYTTNEDAGNSYDAFFTALLLQRASMGDEFWSQYYRNYWANDPPGAQQSVFNQIRNYPGYPQSANYPTFEEYLAAINPFLMTNYYDSLVMHHLNARGYADNFVDPVRGNVPFFAPGTSRFDSAFGAITSRKSFSEGGSRFYDRSALYHTQGEYQLKVKNAFDMRIGASYRQYRPKSDGTILSDTAGRTIRNNEWGTYVGLERKLADDQLTLSATARLDKNQNFDYLVSPAASAVYSPNPNHVIRFSFSSAIRNPTLTDQYLYYNVGRAILIGNTDGYDSLLTVGSVSDFFNNGKRPEYLSYFNLDPVRPERVRTFELGYRATLFNHLYLDANYYFSTYRDFIGYRIGVDADLSRTLFGTYELTVYDVFRIASNAEDDVNSQGFSIGFNYFIGKFYSFTGNYSWNELNKKGSDDPLIPAFNTPRNKYNVGFNGRDIDAMLFNKIRIRNWGFSINYKWVQGFTFEGSPQFTGDIADYGLVDLQLNKKVPSIKCTFKAGASNVLNNLHYEVFGGPLIGRLTYASILVDLTK